MGHSFDLLAEEMDRTVAVAGRDLGMKRPMSFPFSTAESGRDFYGGAERFWQPFSSCKTSSSASMGMRLQFPFTTSQWQELQRQALIYKHIMASVPVPPDLLHPSAAKSFPEAPSIYLSPSTTMVVGSVVGGDGGMSVRAYGHSADPEPGRCRRTDGKKWRCARDAAPDQKYCERHLHRGRPRSRKHVERRGTRSKSINTVVAASPATATATAVTVKSPAAAAAGGGLVPSIELNLPFRSMESNPEPRCQDWMKSYSENLASNKQWEMMQSKIGLNYGTNSDMQHYEELPNLNYTNANDNWCPFLNPNLSSMEETTVADYGEPPRRFIDAWSSENINPTFTNNRDESSVAGRDKLPLSTLTLSMSNAIVDGADIGMKSQPLNWMGPDSPLGGPLAEVLQSSNKTSPRDSGGASSNKNSSDLVNLMSKSCCGSHEASPRASPLRLVSSPSGVLQKALVSLSDSSTSSSPTFAEASRSNFPFLWMNLNK